MNDPLEPTTIPDKTAWMPSVDPGIQPARQAVARAEVAVVGGGLAGSLAAALLWREGIDVILVDPHETCPADFRCEKLEEGPIALMRKIGFADAILEASTHTDTLWVARFGQLVDVQPFNQYSMPYDTMVNAVRARVPLGLTIRRAWVDAIENGPDRQILRLSDGGSISVRLAVLATGGHARLRERLGISRSVASACHSISIGFDIRRTDAANFDFPALQYNPERVGGDVAYLTLFRIGDTMRANLFMYQPLRSPRIAAFRTDPTQALNDALPGLSGLIGTFEVQGPVKVRPTDLHVVGNLGVDGVVLIGDAFVTPCPATGTGTAKVFIDVDRLCRSHVPAWLRSEGMSKDKIAQFYEDESKTKCDDLALRRSYSLKRDTVDDSWTGRVKSCVKFYYRRVRWAARGSVDEVRQVSEVR